MIAVGLMSGTSADGVSAALTEIHPHGVRVRDSLTLPFRAAERRRILALRDSSVAELSEANMALGARFAEAAAQLIARSKARVDVIGSHGQTVFHAPGRDTLQIGEPSVIAERTGITTVADFRPRDIAAGGQGAPLVPFFDRYCFGRRPRPVVLLNIGGIANVAVVGGKAKPVAFDTGPGNCLIDDAIGIITKGRSAFDRGGAMARKGTPDPALLKRLGDHPYFRKGPPKSTGRELFNRDFLLDRCGRELKRRPHDVLATLTHFTAQSIADAVGRWLPGADEVVVSGGGAFNTRMVEHLEWMLFPAPLRPITVYDIGILSKEPAAFALFAALAIQGRENTVAASTGAKHAVVAGKIVPGRNFRALMRRLS